MVHDFLDGVLRLDLELQTQAEVRLNENMHYINLLAYLVQDESGLLLDVIVGEGAAVLELISGEDEALLVRRDAFLVLDLSLDVIDGVAGLDIESDGLARLESLDENLHVDVFKINYEMDESLN